MRTYIYLRKSRKDEQHRNESLEATLQRHETQLFSVAKKLNLNVVKILKEVVSGDSIAARPQMMQLLHDCEEGLLDAVLIMDIDRLGRGDMTDQGIIIGTFKNNDVQIVTPDKTYNLDDEYDEDFFDISAFFARKELKMIKRRLARGKKASLNEGNYIGANAPYGYRKERKSLVIIPEQAKIVQLMFDLYVNNGYGDTRIARYLDEHGILNASGRTGWERTTIRRMINNPIYIGKIAWNKRSYNYEAGKRHDSTLKPMAEWDIYDGKHEAIIDESTFWKAQELAKDRYCPHIHKSKALSNPLAYIMKCGGCNKTMTQRTAKGKPASLRCYRHCGQTASSYISSIEVRLIEMLRDIWKKEQVKYSDSTRSEELERDLLLLEKALEQSHIQEAKFRAQQAKQYDLLEEGVYTTDVFLERSKKVGADIEAEQIKQADLQERIPVAKEKINNSCNVLPRITSSLDFLENVYWELNAEQKNVFLRERVEYVTYYKKKGSKPSDFKLDIHIKL
ncbi:MAG: recombinase family protein [Anaerovoracaceae bacterium]